MSGQNPKLSGQIFALPVILTGWVTCFYFNMAASQKAIATSLDIFPVLKWITVNATPKF
jgi:uncharacterized membrane protein